MRIERPAASRRGNPLGVASVALGCAGFGAGVVLWTFAVDPAGGLFRSMADWMHLDSEPWTGPLAIAAACGGLGVTCAVGAAVGSGRRRGSTFIGLLLSIASLIYPLAYLASVVEAPFRRGPIA